MQYEFSDENGDLKFYDDLPDGFVCVNKEPLEGYVDLPCSLCAGSGMEAAGGQCDYCYGERFVTYTLINVI